MDLLLGAKIVYREYLGEYTIYAWGGITRMVEQFIGALLIHIKRVLSMLHLSLNAESKIA